MVLQKNSWWNKYEEDRKNKQRESDVMKAKKDEIFEKRKQELLQETPSVVNTPVEDTTPSVSDVQTSSTPSINFMDWFQYQPLWIENEHWSAVDPVAIKDAEVEEMLWMPLIKRTYSPEEKVDYYNSLSSWDKDIFDSYVDEWYWFNAAKALMDNKDTFKNPTAEWTAKYEKKESISDNIKNNAYFWFPYRMANALAWLAIWVPKGIANAYLEWKKNLTEDIPRIVKSDEWWLAKWLHIGAEILDVPLGWIWDFIEWVTNQAIKATTTQEERDTMQMLLWEYVLNPILETETVQWWLEDYEELPPETRQVVDDIFSYVDWWINLVWLWGAKWVATAVWKNASKWALKRMAKNLAKYEGKALKAADKIVKGERLLDDVPLSWLKGIDNTKVKTYKDLTNELSKKQDSLIKEVDAIYKKYDNDIPRIERELADPDKSTPFMNMIKDLEVYYKATNNFDAAEKLSWFKYKLQTAWLNKTEQKQLIREYTTDFRKNWFDEFWKPKYWEAWAWFKNNQELAQKTVREWLSKEDYDAVVWLEKSYSDTALVKNRSEALEKEVRAVLNKLDDNRFAKRLLTRSYHILDWLKMARVWQTIAETAKYWNANQLDAFARESQLSKLFKKLRNAEKAIDEVNQYSSAAEKAALQKEMDSIIESLDF